MPDDLGDMFAAVESEMAGGGDVEVVDNPTVESTDVVEGDSPTVENPDIIEDAVDDSIGADDGFDWEAYADQLVPINVAGETSKVSLKELRDGFMRQQDYTRKTQELASERQAAQWAKDVQAAFERNPMETLRAFAEAYGLGEMGQPNQTQKGFDLNDLDEDVRPFAEQALTAQQELAEMKRQMQAWQDQQILEEVRAEVRGLQDRFGDEFDAEGSLRLAAAKNISLQDAHMILMAQRQFEQRQKNQDIERQAAEAAKAEAARAEQARQQQKKQASSVSTKSFKASDIPADDFNDIGELMEQLIAAGGS